MCHDCCSATCNGECHGDDFMDESPAGTNRIKEIRARLQAVQDSHPWTFDSKFEMFMGTTNAVRMWDRNVDLGRTMKNWTPSTDPHIKGYKLSPESIHKNAITKALGEFLEKSREDIEYLLAQLGTEKKQ